MVVTISALVGHGYEVEVIRRALIEAGVVVVMGEGTQLCNTIRDWAKDTRLVDLEKTRMKDTGISRQVIIKAEHHS